MPRFVLTATISICALRWAGGQTVSIHRHVKISDLTIGAKNFLKMSWCYIFGELLDDDLKLSAGCFRDRG